MKASIRKNNHDDVLIIDLKGEVDFASAQPFYYSCIHKLSKKNIVFNLKDLRFVGSDGLKSFLNTMKDLKETSNMRFCCVSPEFRSVFAASEINDIAIYEDEQSATDSATGTSPEK